MKPEIPTIEGLTREQVLTLVNCRGLKQYTAMVSDYQARKCPFCDPLDPKNAILRETANWRLWKNPFPLKNTSLHVILATKVHPWQGNILWSELWGEVGVLFSWARDEFKIPGGAFAFRFGSPEFNAGSVLHLHANIIVPDGTGQVRITLAKEPSEVETATRRMHVFEKMRLGVKFEEIELAEQELVKDRLG